MIDTAEFTVPPSHRQIELRFGQLESLSSANVYFAFPSGAFTYDCVRCQAKCCRGHGYFFGAPSELLLQLQRRKEVLLFVEELVEGSGRLAMNNSPPGCFFLQESGRCGIQIEHGYDSKPETCRLFPFNSYRRLGGVLIVSPHMELCPLQIAAPAVHAKESDHNVLVGELAAGGIGTRIPLANVYGASVNDLINCERELTALATDSFHTGDFFSFVHSHFGDRGSGTSPMIDYLLSFCTRMLGTPTRTEIDVSSDVGRLAIASTPALRARMLFGSVAQDSDQFDLTRDRLPHALVVAYAMLHSSSVAGTQVTYQSFSTIWNNLEPLIRLVALADCRPVWRSDAILDIGSIRDADFRRRFVAIARCLLPGVTNGDCLGDILAANAPDDPIRRVLFLKRIASTLNGKLTIRDRPAQKTSQRPLKQRLMNTAQRWALRNLDDASFLAAFGRTFSSPLEGTSA